MTDQEVLEFLRSDVKELNFKLTCPAELKSVVERLGGKVNEDSLDMNGWQYDWWYSAEFEGQLLTLHGCGYDGTGGIEKRERET